MPMYKETRASRGERLSFETPNLLEFARLELSRGRLIQLRISGTAMCPTIEEGDIITIEPVDPTTIRTHDIVFYASASGTAVVHRVVAVEKRGGCTYVLARADHAEVHDAPIPLSQILGRVVAIERHRTGRLISLKPRPSLASRLTHFLKRLFERR